MLIEQPHALRRIHRRTAAQRDDDIRLEAVHGCDAAHDCFDRRIRLNLRENLGMAIFKAFAQIVEDFVNIAELTTRQTAISNIRWQTTS